MGKSLSHSFSFKYFEQKFLTENIKDCAYKNFELDNIEALDFLLLKEKQLKGFNITIPYKEDILAFLKYKNKAVEEINACNCVKIINGELWGFNTDYLAFCKSIKPLLLPTMKNALILGKGGAAKAVAYALQELNIPYTYAVREVNDDQQIPFEIIKDNWLTDFQIIINCTPVGTYPNVDDCPPLNFNKHNDLSNILFYDLIYNPEKTTFLQLAEKQHGLIKNGYEMLVLQAEASWEIWNKIN